MVQEVLGQRPWVRMAGAFREIPGLLQWQGRAIALLDLASIIEGLRPLEPNEIRPRTLVVRVEDVTLAVSVDEVREVEECDAVTPTPNRLTRLPHATEEVLLHEIPMPILSLQNVVRSLLSAPRRI
jgi:chemotaxis signal transduction protein